MEIIARPLDRWPREFTPDEKYTVVLSMAVMSEMGWQDWRDSWALIRATPLQRCVAALAVVGPCGAGGNGG